MIVCELRYAPSARSPRQESYLHQIRLVNVIDGDRLLADRSGEGVESHGTATVIFDYCLQHSSVDVVKSELVDLEGLESVVCYVGGDGSVTLDQREIPDSLKQSVSYSGSASRARCDA